MGERGVPHTPGPAGDRQDLATDAPGLGGGDGEGVRDPVNLAATVLDRLAEFQREQPRQSVPLFRRRDGRTLQHRGTGRRRQAGDRFRAALRVVQSGPGVVLVGLPRSADGLAHPGPDPPESRPRGDPLAGDQASDLDDLGRCGADGLVEHRRSFEWTA
ncbi:hypothetical protein GCM10027614_00410 [Micromonospora vulcania]